jgi:hypothetical protein
LAKIKARTNTEDLRGNGNILLKVKLKGGERVDRTELNHNGAVSGSCEAEIKLWVSQNVKFLE